MLCEIRAHWQIKDDVKRRKVIDKGSINSEAVQAVKW